VHYERGQAVIEASTNEKSVRNQLYRFFIFINFISILFLKSNRCFSCTKYWKIASS